MDDDRLLLLAPDDNVFVLRAAIDAGEVITAAGRSVEIGDRMGIGHKIARREIASGERVLKYGAPIGRATMRIAVGEHVHLHNLRSGYTPSNTLEDEIAKLDKEPSS